MPSETEATRPMAKGKLILATAAPTLAFASVRGDV